MSNPSKSFDPRLEYVDCMIAATHNEQHNLWSTHAAESSYRPAFATIPVDWAEDGLGKVAQIGELGGFPICVSWSFAVVGGAVLCFYEATSRVVDHDVVRAWADSICTTHTNATNFHNRPQPREATRNVARYLSACDIMRAEMRDRMMAEMAKPPVQPDHDDQRLAAIGIPEIGDGQLSERLAMVVPVDSDTLRRIVVPDLRRVAFTWDPVFGDVFEGLVPAKIVKTLHTFGAPSFFKPSIAEVLAQAPSDLHEYVAFSLCGPESVDDMNRFPACTKAGFHVAEVTYYRKAAP
jgi:hypothetical protein